MRVLPPTATLSLSPLVLGPLQHRSRGVHRVLATSQPVSSCSRDVPYFHPVKFPLVNTAYRFDPL